MAGGLFLELFTVIWFRVNDKYATADVSAFALEVLCRWFASVPAVAGTSRGCRWFAECWGEPAVFVIVAQ